MPDAYSHKTIKNPGCEKNAECGMRNWESILFVFLPHSAFRIPHSAFRKPVAWATNAITEGRARFRIGTQWFSRFGCWNRRASSGERAIAVESRIDKLLPRHERNACRSGFPA